MSVWVAFQRAKKHGRGWKRGTIVWQHNSVRFSPAQQTSEVPAEMTLGSYPYTRHTVFIRHLMLPSEVYEVTLYAPTPERLAQAWQHVLQHRSQCEGDMWVNKTGLKDMTLAEWRSTQRL